MNPKIEMINLDNKLRKASYSVKKSPYFRMISKFAADTVDNSNPSERVLYKYGFAYFSEEMNSLVKEAVVSSERSVGKEPERIQVLKNVLDFYKDQGCTIHHYIAFMDYLIELHLDFYELVDHYPRNAERLTAWTVSKYYEGLVESARQDNHDHIIDNNGLMSTRDLLDLSMDWQYDLLDATLSEDEIKEVLNGSR